MTSPFIGKQILIIGDSLSNGTGARSASCGVVGGCGQFLATKLEQAGAKRVGRTGSRTRSVIN
jgi:lysophospholipase L1-like esterase